MKEYKYTGNASFENAYYDCKLIADGIVDDRSFQEADTGILLYHMDRILEALEKQVNVDNNKYNKNLECIESVKKYHEGKNLLFPKKIYDDMKYVIDKCKEYNLPQPDIYNGCHYDQGISAIWLYDWHLEIGASINQVSILFKDKEQIFDYSIETPVKNIETAFLLVKEFLNHVVILNKGDWM